MTPRRPFLLPALATAAAVLALSTLWPRRVPVVAPLARVQPAVVHDTHALDTAEGEYTRATAELLDALQARRAALPPETTAALDENLKTIDQALGEIRTALDRDPQNTQLARLWSATHRRKVTFLQQLVKLTTRL